MSRPPIRPPRELGGPPGQLVFACPGCVDDLDAENGVHITDASFQVPSVAGRWRNDDRETVPCVQGYCEFGHEFRIEFWAHKGAVIVEIHDTSRSR